MNMVENDYVKEFLQMLENTSAEKFYRATPYTKTDGLDFGGCVSEDLFFERLYVESEKSKENIRNILYTLQNSPESTIIIKGSSGCGKTSFLHDLLYHNKKYYSVIDCEKGIDPQDEDPILTKITTELVCQINEDIINNNAKILKKVKEVFYDNYKNAITLQRFLDGNMLSHIFLKSFFEQGQFDSVLTNLYQGEESAKTDMAMLLTTHLNALNGIQRLFILVAWDICSDSINQLDEIGNVFCIDNLDNVDSDKIKSFLKYYIQFWLNLINAFYSFDFGMLGIDAKELVKKYTFILVLRETTYAKLSEHLNGFEKGMVCEIIADNMYSDCNVFENRSKFAHEHRVELPKELIDEIDQLDSILFNKYIRKKLILMYNNDNNTLMKTLCRIRFTCADNVAFIDEYTKINDSAIIDIRGPYGIIQNIVLTHFREKGYFEHNLMLYNFKRPSENQNYKYSATRLILSYLNNYTEPVSMYQIFQYFDNVIKSEDIATILYNIYMLRFSDWRHLITFTDIPPIDPKWIGNQVKLFNEHLDKDDKNYAKVQITDSGRMYLESIVPHFEFFSVRMENHTPLFCSQGNGIETNAKAQKYISLLDKVYSSVKDCNRRICETVLDICKKKSWSLDDYIKSKFMYTNSNGKKQFHSERVIFSHVGYINAFRKYIISLEDIPEEIRATHNKVIAEEIKKYLLLYTNKDCLKTGRNDNVQKTLYDQTLKVILNNANFDLPIEIEYDE